MLNRNLLAKQWRSYRAEVLPANAPPIQVRECRGAFYAGALAFTAIVAENATPGPEMTEVDMDLGDELDAELKAFQFDAPLEDGWS